jgi:drug/metabolite transporter (DMT)-like permease
VSVTAGQVLSVGCALLAAFLFATAVVFQQEQAVAQSAGSDMRPSSMLGVVAGVIRRPLWLLATLVDFLGFLLQAVALHLGQLTVVQPLLSTVLLFALLLGSLRSGVRLRATDWLGALLLCAGVGGFLASSSPAQGDVSAEPGRLPLLVIAAGGLCIAVLLFAPRRRGGLRAVLLSLAAGVSFALVAALVKEVTGELTQHGTVHVLTHWPVYTLAVIAIGGLTVEQAAFASGPLVPSLITLDLSDPLTSICIGVLVYDETLSGGGAAAGAVIAGIVAITGMILIARSPVTRHVQRPEAVLERQAERHAGAGSRLLPDAVAAERGHDAPPT